MKKSRALFFILVLASALRFCWLGSNPPALSWDEAAWGYNAYSLGLDGRDEFGRFLPLNYLESFGDFKPPVYAYLTILPVKLFGLNAFATRFASAFAGVLTVWLTYWLAKEILCRHVVPPCRSRSRCFATSEERLSLLGAVAALLLAISPWHIMLSRAAFEANVASFFLVAGVLGFLKAMRQSSRWLLASVISFTLSLYTFNTARIIAPLLVLGLVVGFRQELWQKKKQAVLAALTGIVFLLPILPFLLTPQAKLRFHEVNIFSDSSVVIQANQEMENDSPAGELVWWSKIIHNRRWGYTREFLRHYFDHFNPAFLFIRGDGNPKFSIQDVGQLYLWELPFLIAGILLLFKRKPGYWWLIPFWLLVGILPAATARETPHSLRIENTLPTWQMISALGVIGFLEWLEKRQIKRDFKFIFLIFNLSFVILNFTYFLHSYIVHYPREYSREWQYGYREVAAYLQEVEGQHDRIWMTNALGRPYIYLLFHQKRSPEEFRRLAEVEREVMGFVKVKSFGKYHFDKDTGWEKGMLYVDLPENVPSGADIKREFKLLNGEPILKAFQI